MSSMDNFEAVSKSAKKRQMDDLFSKVEALTALPNLQIKQLELDENLIDSLLQIKTMKQNSARKRLISYIRGRLTKLPVTTLEQLNVVLDNASNRGLQDSACQSSAQQWMYDLSDSSQQRQLLSQWLQQYPKSNLQQLRQLLRNVVKANSTGDGATAVSKEQKKLLLWLTTQIRQSAAP